MNWKCRGDKHNIYISNIPRLTWQNWQSVCSYLCILGLNPRHL